MLAVIVNSRRSLYTVYIDTIYELNWIRILDGYTRDKWIVLDNVDDSVTQTTLVDNVRREISPSSPYLRAGSDCAAIDWQRGATVQRLYLKK